MNELQTVQAVDLKTINPATLQTLKDTVAQGATDSELSMFLTLAGTYKLDPFARQIYFMKAGDKPTIITGRDGYLAIAQRDPAFEGLLSGTVHENDQFEIDTMDGKVIHKPNLKDSGQIVGAWAIAYHKTRKPAPVYVKFSEYKKAERDKWDKLTPWGQYPSSMIEKVAEARALKRQFGISGLVTEEEMGTEAPRAKYGNDASVPVTKEYIEQKEAYDEPKFKRGVEVIYNEAGEVLQDLLEHQGKDPTTWKQMVAVKVDALYQKGIYETTKKEMETIRDGIQVAFDRLLASMEDAPTLEEIKADVVEAEVIEETPSKKMTPEEVESLFNEQTE